MLKIFTYLDHTKRPATYAYICAESMTEAAEIIGLPLQRIRDHLSLTTGDKQIEYQHLKRGEFVYPNKTKITKGISLLDFERIAALGYLKSAKMALHQCDLNPEEKERLSTIIGLIDELRADVSDRLEVRYKDR